MIVFWGYMDEPWLQEALLCLGFMSLWACFRDVGLVAKELRAYLEVHCTYNLLSNCSYNPIISRVTIVMGLIFRS